MNVRKRSGKVVPFEAAYIHRAISWLRQPPASGTRPPSTP